jgi:putative Mg2+ transporter-C (MgtC) family protein
MTAEAIFVRLLVSLILGALIGAEREWNHHAAGLKTNALVSVGAATFLIFGAAAEGAESLARVGAQVVSGIGFLGGGIILREGLNIRGLNTAATLWCSAGVGVLAGAGLFTGSVLAAAVVFGGNLGLRRVASHVTKLATRREGAAVRYTITVTSEPGKDAEARRVMLDQIARGAYNPRSLQVSSFGIGLQVESRVILSLPARDDPAIESILAEVRRLVAASHVNWTVEPASE